MLVTVEELCDYMDVRVPDEPKYNAATWILEGLQSELESWLRRPIEVGTFTETFDTTVWNGVNAYELPVGYAPPVQAFSWGFSHTPVTEVLSVYHTAVGGASVIPEALHYNVNYSITGYGINLFAGLPYGRVTVTYKAGLDGEDIKAFRGMILRAAAREYQNMYDDNRGIQDLNTRQAALQVTGFLDSELERVRRYKRQRI